MINAHGINKERKERMGGEGRHRDPSQICVFSDGIRMPRHRIQSVEQLSILKLQSETSGGMIISAELSLKIYVDVAVSLQCVN